ncbi:hypothetical protein BJ170DRAFT_564210, partial [Xylariales sp. AK1849]
LVASLFSKTQMLLHDPRWQTVPWGLDPTSESPQSYLLDIFVIIPGILKENHRLEEVLDCHSDDEFIDPPLIFNDNSLRRAEPCDRIASQLGKLYQWRWNWQRNYGHNVKSTNSGCEPDGLVATTHGLFGNSRRLDKLSFDRPVHANNIMLYNSALMWLLALLWKLEPLEAGAIIESCVRRPTPSPRTNHHASFEPLRRPGLSVSIRDPAMEICRVYEWKSRNHNRCAASGDQMCLYLFPVGMGGSVLDREPENKEWIESMLDVNPATSGYAREGQSLAGFGFYVTKASLDPD